MPNRRKIRSTEKNSHFLTLQPCLNLLEEIKTDLKNQALSATHSKLASALFLLGTEGTDQVSPLKSLKEIGAILYNAEEPSVFALRTLTRYYLIGDSRHPMKRAIAGLLENFKDETVRNNIAAILAEALEKFMQSCASCNTPDVRHLVVENYIAYMDNFNLGRLAIQSLIGEVLIFLNAHLEALNSMMEVQLNSAMKSAITSYITTAVKCCTTAVQKCLPSDKDTTIIELLYFIISACRKFFFNDDLQGDCWNASGIFCAVAWKVVCTEEQYLEKVKAAIADSDPITKGVSSPDSVMHGLGDGARLSLCSGFLAIMDASLILHPDNNGQCLLLHVFLPFIDGISSRSKDLIHELSVAKFYVQWTIVLRKSCLGDLAPSVKRSLLEDQSTSGSIADKLLQYALTKLEHPVDAVRHQSTDMLSNLLSALSKISGNGFSERLAEDILKQNWQKRSAFTALNCILDHVCSEFLLSKHPDLLKALLEAMQQQSLVPYASEMYKNLAIGGRHKNEANDCERFLFPLLEKMCSASHHYLRLLIDYCYMKLLTVYGAESMGYLTKFFSAKLSNRNQTSTSASAKAGALAAVLACLRAALSRGYLEKDMRTENSSLWGGVIRKEVLASALVHQGSEIRITAFALFCESTKPSNLVAVDDLNAILCALPYNVSSQDPGFRQQLLNIFKKLFSRLAGNISQLLKTSKKDAPGVEKAKSTLESYFNFILKLGRFSVSQLYSAAPYPKRMTCLSMLSLIAATFAGHSHFDFKDIFSDEGVELLFGLLSDPYDDVRREAFILLTNPNLRDIFIRVLTPAKLLQLENSAVVQAYECRKPELCCDASYHLRLCAAYVDSGGSSSRNEVFLRLLRVLQSKLEESIVIATKSLFLASTNAPLYGLLHCMKGLLADVAFRTMSATERKEWRGLLSRMVVTCFQVSEVVLPVVGSVSPEGHLPDVEVASKDESVDGGCNDAWNELPEILQSLILGSSEEKQDEMKTRALAQTVLVCCWRSAKEATLLLQELTSSRLPLDLHKDSSDGVLSWHMLIDIGEHLRRQLMEARHRGAFEIAYSAFKAYCPRLWMSEHANLNSLPEQWLRSVLSDIEDPSRSKELCVTRRSAGLPFFMQALLGCCKNQAAKKNIQLVMAKLLTLCDDEMNTEDKSMVTKVHSLNILRGLVKDASLGEEILPYVSRCMQVALTGFGSSVWAIRNSSTLLYSCLVTRIFGVKRDKDDHLSMKNRLSGHEFFTRLPGLRTFLLSRLEDICSCLEKGGHYALNPVLHPILLLLCRIYPSTMQLVGSDLSLAEFVPLVLRCRSSAVYKSRVAAATALSSIVCEDNCVAVLQQSCDRLEKDALLTDEANPSDEKLKSSPNNRIHGTLLQIKAVMEARFCPDGRRSQDEDRTAISLVSASLDRCVAHLTRQNQCPVTRASALDLFSLIYAMGQSSIVDPDRHRLIATAEMVKTSCIEELTSMRREGGSSAPGHSFLHESLSKVLVQLCSRSADELICVLEKISSSADDVMLVALRKINHRWSDSYRSLFNEEETRRLEVLLVDVTKSMTWNTQLHTEAYLLLSKIASSYSADTLLLNAIQLAASCNSSQSSLVRSLLAFQSSCMQIVLQTTYDEKWHDVIHAWVELLLTSSASHENSDDVRLAAAEALLKNADDVLLDRRQILAGASVRAWIVVIRLLCDEEADVRKVASDIVHSVARKSGVVQSDYPSVDTLGLKHALLTLLVTHGRRQASDCREALLAIPMGEPTAVPFSVDTNAGSKLDASGEQKEGFFPGLFDRSEANTYWDSVAVSRVLKCGMEALDEPGFFDDDESVVRRLNERLNIEL